MPTGKVPWHSAEDQVSRSNHSGPNETCSGVLHSFMLAGRVNYEHINV